MTKKHLLWLGLLTGIGFPIPAFIALWFFDGISPIEILDFKSSYTFVAFLGFPWGISFAFLVLAISEHPFLQRELARQTSMIENLKLSISEKIFLSICAGFGEEILFRIGVQHWLGVFLTTFIFIAIHGYLNPKKKGIFIYGILLFPFIFSLGFWLEKTGIWFAIYAHFAYDFILFLNADSPENSSVSSNTMVLQQSEVVSFVEQPNTSEEQLSDPPLNIPTSEVDR